MGRFAEVAYDEDTNLTAYYDSVEESYMLVVGDVPNVNVVGQFDTLADLDEYWEGE